MNTNKTINITMALLVCVQASAIKVHTIGDSTMAEYDESATVTRGWGQYLQMFLNDVTVNNRGKSGASSKSFYQEAAYWTSVKKQLNEGDYVFIQFAHNDEKNNGMDGDSVKAYYNSIGDTDNATSTDYRGTTPYETYKDYLRLYIEETRQAGCIPILVGPICRMYFTGNTIRRNGKHDLGDSFSSLTAEGILTSQEIDSDDHTMDYVYNMEQVAQETGTAFLDLTTATAELYASYGDTKCHDLLSDGEGSTHLNATGATLIARLCAQLMIENNILQDNVNLTTDLAVFPQEADLGESYVGQTLTKEFTLTAYNLNPSEGEIEITATQDLSLSIDAEDWQQSISLTYSDGTLVKTFYTKITLQESGETYDTITITQGEQIIKIPVTATAVTPEDGENVLAYWRLDKTTQESCSLTGPATVIDETFSELYVQRYSAPNANTTWPEETGFDASRITQRVLIEGDTWPDGEIDEVSTRYVQFGITPAIGTKLNIDSIGLYVCGCGGNGMMCHIYWSIKENFEDPKLIFSPTKMAANNMMAVSSQPVISLLEGDTLRLRIYPWYTNEANGKTICLSDVTFKGVAVSEKGDEVFKVQCQGKENDERIYTLNGTIAQKISNKGIYIRRGKKYFQ